MLPDWDFPTFDSHIDIKLPFADVTELKVKLPKKLTEKLAKVFKADFFHANVTGKWFSYGPLLCIICLDLMMMKNQLVYEPHLLGQYTNPDNRIYTCLLYTSPSPRD